MDVLGGSHGDGSGGGSVEFISDGSICRVTNLSHTTVASILKAISVRDAPPFHTLELCHGDLDQYAMEKLTQMFVSMHSSTITTVKLANCPLSEGIMTVLVRCFKETKYLQHIVLNSCRDVSMTSLMALAALVPHVEILELPSCRLPRQAGLILSQAFQSCANLQTLVLRNNALGDGGARAIADAFLPKKTRQHSCESENEGRWVLNTLDLSGNGISNVGFACILATCVRHLRVSHNKITSIQDVATARHLNTLDISCNPISHDGFDSMARVLSSSHLSRLTSLNIENCRITVDGLNAIKEAIRANPDTKMREIRLGEDNSIEDPKTRIVLTELLKCVSHVAPQIECIISPTVVPQQTPREVASSGSTMTPRSPHSSSSTQSEDMDEDNQSTTEQHTTSINAAIETKFGRIVHQLSQQQQNQNDDAMHHLTGKVKGLELSIPRLESRLDGLSDRVAIQAAQLPALQAEVAKLSAISQHDQRREGNLLDQGNVQDDAKDIHMDLAKWKTEMEVAQRHQFRQWQKYIDEDRAQLLMRVNELESKVVSLENFVKAEQQASLLALEAISSAIGHQQH
ncbi:hypothetical protein Ae201684P_020560 [Aphanomyces euteiches]|nr:hypothetical protein Ae201684P_020560 [Aphanomyces euteiches]KAH9133566.1 hypothetical protein AeRB84_020347 [Aphanomyces euteiches]